MAHTVNLPEKWHITGTGAPDTISEVFDEHNRRRGHILHKTEGGKLTHELVLDTRYGVRQAINPDVTESTIYFGEENGTILFSAGNLKLPEYTVVNDAIRFTPGPGLEAYRQKYDALVDSAFNWGMSNYPHYSNPRYYWDEESGKKEG
jgi:hypothetical protein